jgi:hypothetical protein
MTDSYGNTSQLNFKLNVQEPPSSLPETATEDTKWDLQDNILVLQLPGSKGEEIKVNGQSYKPAYREGNTSTFLVDMRKNLPDKIITGNDTLSIGIQKMIPHRSRVTFERTELKLDIPSEALFDTLYLSTDYSIDEAHNRELFLIGDEYIPMRKRMTVTLRPQLDYKDKSKIAAYALDSRNNAYYVGGDWQGNNFVFTTRDMGRFTLLPDNRPPTVKALTLSSDQLRFQIDDDLSGIDTFDCYVNGQWVCMYYDYKRKLLWSEKKSESDKFTGEVKLVVKDNVNNVKQYTTKIN